jgi:outer membrane protein assembly factor BamB
MVHRSFSFIALTLLSSVAPVSAQPAPLSTQKNSNLTLPASTLLTNGLPGLSGPPINLMVSSAPSSSAQGGAVSLPTSQQWERRYNGPANNEDQATAITIDKDGNVIVGGYSLGIGTDDDFLTIKYTSDGVALWTNRFDGPEHGTDKIVTVATDGSGGVYASGDSGGGVRTVKYAPDGTPAWTSTYTNSSSFLSFQALAVDTDGNSYLMPFDLDAKSFVTIKYDPNGNSVWTNTFKSSPTSVETPSDVAVDADGNIFVTGSSIDGTIKFLTIKYASDGSPLWINSYSLVGSESAQRVIVDPQGNVIVVGDSQGGGAQHKYVIVKYSNSGTLLWTNAIAAAAYVGGGVPQVATDSAGNVFIVGGTPGAASSAADYTSVKLSSAGVPVWTNRFFESSAGTAGLFGAGTDNAGNLYWSINSASPNNTNYNYVTLKYAATNGTPVWTNRYNSSFNASDLPRAMTVDKAGGVYVTGTSSTASGNSFNTLDWDTIKYADNLHYIPPTNFVGPDTLTFTAFDSLGDSAVGAVTVNVLPDPIAVVAPVNYTSAAGNLGANTLVRSTNSPRTFQMQFTPAALGGLPVGARITALGFRLLTNNPTDFPTTTTAWSDYEVTLAQAANPIASMSTTFQANLLNPVLVRSGPLSVATGIFTTSHNPNPFATMLVFNTPYIYQGGDLMMHFIHTGSDSALTAFLDSASSAAPGYGTSFRAVSANTNVTTTGTANSPITIVEIVFTTTRITSAANQLIITGSGGLPSETYQILTATNPALPAAQWTPIATDQFSGSGGFNYTNGIQPAVPAQYFRVVMP